MHGEQQYAAQAIKAGASGYLTKDSAADELVQAVSLGVVQDDHTPFGKPVYLAVALLTTVELALVQVINEAQHLIQIVGGVGASVRVRIGLCPVAQMPLEIPVQLPAIVTVDVVLQHCTLFDNPFRRTVIPRRAPHGASQLADFALFCDPQVVGWDGQWKMKKWW